MSRQSKQRQRRGRRSTGQRTSGRPVGQRARLSFESLESRLMLSADNPLWYTMPELSLSFAPDGTEVAGQTSALYAELESLAEQDWQQTIADALEAWTQHTGTEIVTVQDRGVPFRSAGTGFG